MAIVRHKIMPWDWDRLSLDVRRWLGPIASVLRDIEDGR